MQQASIHTSISFFSGKFVSDLRRGEHTYNTYSIMKSSSLMRKIIPFFLLLFIVGNTLSGQVTFTAGSATIPCDATSTCVEVEVSNFDSIVGMQFSYTWDAGIIDLTNYNNYLPPFIVFDESAVASGQLSFSWFEPNFQPFSLNDGDVIIELCFSPVAFGTSPIDFDTPLLPGAPIEVTGFQNGALVQSLPTSFLPGSVTVGGNNGPPVIVCPNDVVMESSPTMVSGIGLVSASDCDIDQITYAMTGATTGSGSDDASGEFFNTGTTTVTYTVSDLTGNEATCSFTVTLNPPPANADNLQFIPQIDLNCDNNTVSIDVIVNNFDSISGYQFGVFWDTSEIVYLNHVNGMPPIAGYNTTFATSDGYIFTTWFHPSPPTGPFSVSLPDGSIIFTLNFQLVGPLTLPALTFGPVNVFAPVIITSETGNLDPSEYEFQGGTFVNITDNTSPDFGTTCPSDTIIYAPIDDCAMRFNFDTPVATDACDTNLDYNNSNTLNSGDDFPVGITTWTITATDDAGNSSTCSFDITVLDTIAPELTCPNPPDFSCPDEVAGLLPSYSDACGILTVDYSIPGMAPGINDASNVDFPFGVTQVTYVVTDLSGNSSSCSFTVTVIDDEDPILTCPGNISANAAGPTCSTNVTVPTPTIDDCGPVSITYTINSVSTLLPSGATSFQTLFSVGTTVVTYTVEDGAGNTSTCSLNVVVTDTAPPTITCPGNITITLAGSQMDTVLNNISAIANDNCVTATVTYTLTGPATAGPFTNSANLSTFSVGQTTVTYTATANGQSSTCSFVVTINAPSSLSITCPDPVLDVDADAPFCADLSITGLGVTINPGSPAIAEILFTLTGATTLSDTLNASGNAFNVGTTIITYFVTDVFGNTATCSLAQEVVDLVRPVIVCPTVDAFPVDPGTCVATIATNLLLPVSVTDNCGMDSLTFELSGELTGTDTVSALPTVFPIGITNIEYTAIDIYGNIRRCNFDVVVNDTEGPEVTCPSNLTIIVPIGTTDTVLNNLGVTNVSDVCGTVTDTSFITSGALTITNGDADISGTAFPVGQTTVTYTVTDNSNNTSTCSFIVEVVENNAVDLIDCPDDIDACDNVVTALPIYIVDPNDIATLSYSTTTVGSAPTEFINVTLPVGPTVVTYMAEDVAGNTDVCSFVINVDNVPPTLSGCQILPLEFSTAPGECTAVVNWSSPTASDNCSVASLVSNMTSPIELPIGSHTISYTATDLAGNTAQCSFTINVVDNEAPAFSNCPPGDIVLTPTGGPNCAHTVTWTVPTATDFCSTNITYTSNYNPGDVFTAPGDVVVYTATDESGNTALCTFMITVADNSDPVLVCPNNVVVDSDPSLCGGIATWNSPTATDDCSTTGISCTHVSGDTFDIGETVVICLAIDAAGNSTTCSFTVTVNDNSPPLLMGCPQGVLANADEGLCGAEVIWQQITATDDCDQDIEITSNFEQGDFFPVGITEVVYTATDDGGNTTTCSFIINVEDNEDPVIACPADVTMLADGTIQSDLDNIIITATPGVGCNSVFVDYLEPAISDNCPAFTVTMTGPASGSELPLGLSSITYEVTDVFGHTTTCDFTILVLPVTGNIQILASPNDTVCVGDVTLSVVGGALGATYAWAGPNGSNSTDPVWTIPPFTGLYAVVCTSAGGCTSSASINMTFGTQPEINVTSNSPVCGEGDLEFQLTGAPAGSTVLWVAPNGDTFTDEDLTITNPSSAYSGEWDVTVSLLNGVCQSTLSIEVIVGDLPNVTVNSDCDGAICLGETCTIIGQAVASSNNITYNWASTPEGCIPEGLTGSTFEFTPTTAGDCEIYYWVSFGNCMSTIDTLLISVSGTPEAVNDNLTVAPSDSLVNISLIANDVFNMSLGFEVNLVTPLSNIPGTVTLTEGGLMNYNPQGYFGQVSFVYELCVNCDAENCTNGIVVINVSDESCRVPNVITPNGDEVNDLLVINCLDTGDFEEAELQVFNQWGDEVFYAKPYENDWGGTLNGEKGKDLPDGTYFYIFKLDNNAEVDKAYITIFR
jgi:gliding motility-associated-like protein